MASDRVGHGDPSPRTKNMIPMEHKPPVDVKTVRCTVARGRSVMILVGRRPTGFHPVTEEPVFAPITQYVEEFNEVDIPETDVAWMRKAGFLIDPEASQAALRSEGPSFTEVRDAPKQTSAYAR